MSNLFCKKYYASLRLSDFYWVSTQTMIYWFQSEMTRPGTGAHKGGPDRAIPRLWAKWWAGTWQGSYTHGNLCQGPSPGFFVNHLSVSYFSIFNLSILILFYFIFPYPIFPYPIFPCPKSTPPRSSHILLSQISSSDYPLFKFPILSINITCLFLIILIFRKKIPENTVSVHNMT